MGVRHPAVLDEPENGRCNCPASQPGGEKGYGLSRIERFQRKAPGKRPGDDCGGAIRSESNGRRRKGRRPDEMECNLRGKRQDPWRKANDPANAGCRPCGKGPDTSESQKYPDRVRRKRAGRCVKPGLRSLTRKPKVETPEAGSAAGPESVCNVHAGERSVGKLAASITRRVTNGRLMPVIGERERGELPHPIFPATGRKARGRDP